MAEFPDVSESVARRMDRAMVDLARLGDLASLETCFIETALQLLPVDSVAWNNWSLDGETYLSGRLNPPYQQRFELLLDAFAESIPHHPIIAAGEFWSITDQVLQMSDFQSQREFRGNPLFREVYRHLDSEFQIVFSPVALEDRRIVLGLNRSFRDFGGQEQQMLRYLGLRLAHVARWVERKQRLHGLLEHVTGMIGESLQLGSLADFSLRDVQMLEGLVRHGSISALARASGIRRDTVDKRLGAIRERLHLDHHRQLLSAFAELRQGRIAARPQPS